MLTRDELSFTLNLQNPQEASDRACRQFFHSYCSCIITTRLADATCDDVSMMSLLWHVTGSTWTVITENHRLIWYLRRR